MKPGPKLDALIAEKVMKCGFRVVDPSSNLAVATATDIQGCYLEDYSGGKNGFRQFRPSTRIQYAWEVVEKMRTTHGFRTLSLEQNKSGDWSVGGWGWFPTIYEDTAPMAICLAALKAVE